MIDIYGIPNCGSVKKALQWARENGVDFVFHNFKTEAPSVELIDKWMDEIGAARLLNRSSQTWKSLDPSVRTAAAENPAAIKQLLATSPLLIKRPVIVCGCICTSGERCFYEFDIFRIVSNQLIELHNSDFGFCLLRRSRHLRIV